MIGNDKRLTESNQTNPACLMKQPYSLLSSVAFMLMHSVYFSICYSRNMGHFECHLTSWPPTCRHVCVVGMADAEDSRGVYVIHSPELEDPVPDGVVVKRIQGRHSVRDIELLPVGNFVWRTLHPGHFQTCNSTRFTRPSALN